MGKMKAIDKILESTANNAYLRGAENTLNLIVSALERGQQIDKALKDIRTAINESRAAGIGKEIALRKGDES